MEGDIPKTPEKKSWKKSYFAKDSKSWVSLKVKYHIKRIKHIFKISNNIVEFNAQSTLSASSVNSPESKINIKDIKLPDLPDYMLNNNKHEISSKGSPI